MGSSDDEEEPGAIPKKESSPHEGPVKQGPPDEGVQGQKDITTDLTQVKKEEEKHRQAR